MHECIHNMKKEGKILLAVDAEGNIMRRTYIKGVATPRGPHADELVDYTNHPGIEKILSAPEYWYLDGETFKQKVNVKVTNQNGGKVVNVGDTVPIEFKGVPEDIDEFVVEAGGREVIVKRGETLNITSAKPARIVIIIKDKRIHQKFGYVLVFTPRVNVDEMVNNARP